jgi:hypothetical protein
LFFTKAELTHYSPELATVFCAGVGIWLVMTDRLIPSYFFFLAAIISRIMEAISVAGLVTRMS